MPSWVENQVVALKSLAGLTVAHWHGIEMAIREVGADGLPQWRDDSVSFLQLYRLDLMLNDGTNVSILTYQNDDRFGLCRNDESLPWTAADDPYSIFRPRSLEELPTGTIQDVSVAMNRDDIAEVCLDIQGRRVQLWAGEIYEEVDGSLRVVFMDESVLVQVDQQRP